MVSPGKAARRKGHNFERTCARIWKNMGWDKAKRHLEYQSEEAELGQDLDGTYPFMVQCKAHKNYCSVNTIKEIEDQVGHYPMVITKGDNQEPMVIIPFWAMRELLEMLKVNKIF